MRYTMLCTYALGIKDFVAWLMRYKKRPLIVVAHGGSNFDLIFLVRVSDLILFE